MTDASVLPLRTSCPDRSGAGRRRRSRRLRGSRRARSVIPGRTGQLLRAELWRWALVSGRSVDVDAGVILLEVLGVAHRSSVVVTDDLLTEIVWIDARRWCETHGVELPNEFAAAVHTCLDFLAQSGRMHPDSDDLEELHDLVDAVGAPRAKSSPCPTA